MGDKGGKVSRRADLVALRQAGGNADTVADIRPRKADRTEALRGKMRALLARGIEEFIVEDYEDATVAQRLKFLDILGKYGMGPARAEDLDARAMGKGLEARVVMLPSLDEDAS